MQGQSPPQGGNPVLKQGGPAARGAPPYIVLRLHCWAPSPASPVTYTCSLDDQKLTWTPTPPGGKQIKGIYRVVLFCDDPKLNSPDNPYLVFDTHADTLLSFTDITVDLTAYILHVINQFSHATLILSMVAHARSKSRAAYVELKEFSLHDRDGNARKVNFSAGSSDPYKLKDSVENRGVQGYSLAQNFVTSQVPLSLTPQFKPEHLTSVDWDGPAFKIPEADESDATNEYEKKALVTLIQFRRWSEIAPGHGDFFVFYFNMNVPNRSGSNKLGSALRTFWKVKPRDYQADEIPDAWLMIQRPARTISPDPLTPEDLRSRPSARWVFQICGVPARGVVEDWELCLPTYHDALEEVRGGNPLSFVPLLFRPAGADASARAVMTYRLEDGSNQGAEDKPQWKFVSLGDTPENGDFVLFRPLSLHFWDNADRTFTLHGSLPKIRASVNGHALQGLEIKIKTDKNFDSRTIDIETTHGIVLSTSGPITVKGSGEFASAVRMGSVRMGALDLLFGENSASFNGTGRLVLRPNGPLVEAEASAHFNLQNVLPGGQDDPASEEFVPENSADISADPDEQIEREIDGRFRPRRPVLIPVSAAPSMQNYLLQVTELVQTGKSQTLNLKVLSQAAGEGDSKADACATANDSVIVLDTNPFLVAEVRYPAFQQASLSDNTIAQWTNTGSQGSGWKLLFKSAPFCMVLPPQAVGEQMIKGTEDGPIPTTSPLPFNFGQLTRLTVNPGDDLTNFNEVPWNLRRVLGTPDQPRGPEVRLMQYELLYGFTCDATEPLVRLSELFSRVGRIPARRNPNMAWDGTLVQKNAYKKARKDWSVVYQRYLSRVAVLEPSNNIPFAGPENSVVLNSTNLSCRFRLGPASNIKLPFPIDPNVVDGNLAGGATWGFESKNVLQATVLAKDPTNSTVLRQSSSAELADFYLSSLGGWGRQMAAFQNDLTKIYSDVEMGRTFQYKVERIGRIGVFWNRAKHVVVFERAVIPSQQFYQEQSKNVLAGWPVLRKVREYVEILEDTRCYPDADPSEYRSDAEKTAQRLGRGFVAKASFAAGAQFNILSSWGADVGDYGWKVPLWNPGAQPAALYPKPAITLGVANGNIDKGEIVPCDISEPQNVVFYTQTSQLINGKLQDPERDPSKWAPVEGVDYVNAPQPRPPRSGATSQEFANGDIHQYAANESPAPPGYGPCTFSLEKPAAPINIIADRSQEVLLANLSSITMVRGNPRSTSWPQQLTNLASLEEHITQGCQQLLSQIPIDGTPGPDVATAIKNVLAQDPFKALKSAVLNAKGEVQRVHDQVLAQLNTFEQATSDKLLARLNADLSDPLQDLQNKMTQFQQAGQATQVEARQTLTEFQHAVEEKLMLIQSVPGVARQFVARYAQVVVALNRGLTTQLTTIRQQLSNKSSVDDALSQVENLIAEAKSLYDSFDTIGRNLPFSWLPDPSVTVRASLKSYFDPEQFDAATSGLLGALRGLNDNQTVNAQAAIDAFTNSAYCKQLKSPAELAQFLKTYLEPVDADFAKISTALQSVEDRGSAILTQWLADANAAITKVTDLSTLRTQVTALQNWLQGANGTLQTSIHSLLTNATTTINLQANLLLAGLDNANTFLSGIDQQFNDAVKAATTAGLAVLQKTLEDKRDEIVSAARDYLDQAAPGILKNANQILQNADPAIRLVRAFGEPPRVPQLDFQRSELGYYFNALAPNVDMTPVVSVVNQGAAVLDAVKPLGLKMPTVGALDQLIPAELKSFDVSQIFPHFAGLDLSHMFSG